MRSVNESGREAGRSWVESANATSCDFPLANLPYCAFRAADGEVRLGVGIGNFVFDLKAAAGSVLLASLPANVRAACAASVLNDLIRCGSAGHAALRMALLRGFGADSAAEWVTVARSLLRPIAGTEFCLPVQVGNYTDFYASIHHATNVGRIFRPEQPLLPNYKYVPIGYHGRASSISVSGAPVVRPHGQLRSPEEAAPVFAPCRQLDFELEMGAYLVGGNEPGQRIPAEDADEQLFGLSLLNDWSARDVQTWESQPLGPFLSKSFITSVSPWVVPMEALAPFRVAVPERPAGDPEPLPHLSSAGAARGAFDIQAEVLLVTRRMRDNGEADFRLATANVKDLYWTFAQMVTHHASNGCNLMAGDLIGSGTLSGAEAANGGSLLELTRRGADPIALPNGERRSFLEDGDEVVLRAFCERDGYARIGFGECRAVVLAAN